MTSEDVRSTATLLRFVSALFAWGFFSTAGAEALWSLEDHRVHVVIFSTLGVAAIAVALAAPVLAARIHGEG